MTPLDCIEFRGERWNVVHEDYRRQYYTLERARRWFKGRLLAVGRETVFREANPDIHLEAAPAREPVPDWALQLMAEAIGSTRNQQEGSK